MSKPLNRRRARQRRPQDTPDPAERVAVLTRTARGAWLGLLAYLAFVGVTLMGVEDADFFLTERQTELPLIGVSVPTTLFFYIAPFLGAMLYIHMHLYLLKLWKALGELPSGATRPAAERIPPWIVSDMALAQRAGGVHAYPRRSLARWVAILSIFVAGPAVLAAFWWRSMPKHDEVLTILFCGLPLFASTLAGWESWRALRRGGAEARHMPWGSRADWGAGAVLLSIVGFLTTEGTFAKYAQLNRVNLIVTDWEFPSLYERKKQVVAAGLKELASDEDDLSEFKARFDGITEFPDPDDLNYLADRLLERRWWMRTWVPGWLRPAQLQGVVFVETPTGWLPRDEAEQVFRGQWCAEQGIPRLACGPGPLARDDAGDQAEAPAYLSHQRLLWCQEAMGETIAEAPCKGFFEGLDETYPKAWREARATAIEALPERDLSYADLRRANLREARLEGADLGLARMERADLREARMEGADLGGARMEFAKLGRARMEGAALWHVDLSSVQNISQAQVASAFGDASVTLPEGMARRVHWPDWDLDPVTFAFEWSRWQADPDGYAPPPEPEG